MCFREKLFMDYNWILWAHVIFPMKKKLLFVMKKKQMNACNADNSDYDQCAAGNGKSKWDNHIKYYNVFSV